MPLRSGLALRTPYRNRLPPGRNCGHLCSVSRAAASGVGTEVLGPPDAETDFSAERPSAYSTTPSAFHVPPALLVVDMTVNVWGGPPATFTTFSLPPAKNPTA